MSLQKTVLEPQPGAAAAARSSKWYDSTFLVMVLLFVLWPVGVFALIKNRRLGGFGKFVIGGGVSFMLLVAVGASGFAGYWYYKHRTFANLPYVGKYLRKSEVADAKAPAQNDTPSDKNTPPADNPPKDPADSKPLDRPADPNVPNPKFADANIPAEPKALDQKPNADAERLAEERRKLDEAEQRARALAIAKEKFAAEKENAERAERERVLAERAKIALAEKERAAFAEKERIAQAEREKTAQAERERADAEQRARSIDALAAELRDRHTVLIGRKQQQAAKYQRALGDYKLAANIESDLSNLEIAFKKHLIEAYKSDEMDEAKFNDYFTEEYLRDYNSQLQRKHTAMSQYIKTIRNSDAQMIAEEAKLNAEIAALNDKLAAARKARIDLPPPEPDLERTLKEARDAAGNLPERLVTLNDLRQRMGIKPGRRPAVADNRNPPPGPPVRDPFDQKAPKEIADTVPLPPLENKTRPPEPLVKPPPRISEPRTQPPANLPPAPPAIAAVDMQGDWTRGDGRVVWLLEAGGTMTVRGPKRTQGSWVFDEKTSVLSLTQGGVFYKFTVSKDRDQLSMTGGAGANATLRFNKTPKP